MSDLVTIPANPQRSGAATGGAIRINTFEELSAGTYWRAKDDVPELTKPERRERGTYLPKDHPDYIEPKGGWNQSERNRVGTEHYMVDVPVRSGVPAGRMHLLLSLKLVDGDVHAVVLKGHPTEGERANRTFLVDEFLGRFEIVPEDEAKAIRDAEVAAIQADIARLQQAMIDGPPPEAPTGLIGHQASLPAPSETLPERLPPKPGVGTMIANIGHVERLRETAERAVAIAERQSKWISTHSKEIGERTQAMIPFFQERASAALATTESVMRYATGLQKGVESLGLYTGKDVEVTRLADGKGAPAGEPLRIYRDMLYMDEEYVVHVETDDAAGAGADHHDFDDFMTAMLADERLKARIFPYPRMVILMRYRRKAKAYYPNDTMEGLLANAELNRPNGKQFLLIRNGEQYYQVWSDLTTQSISALFPNQRMADAPFRGVDGDTISMDDLNLSEAKTRFDNLATVYKNLAILLWGLHDRGPDDNGVDFGPFYDPADWTPQGFIDAGFQARNMVFWDPYGEQTVIGRGLPRFADWVHEKNGWLRSGSCALVTDSVLYQHDGYNGSRPTDEQPAALSRVREGSSNAYEFVVRRTKKGHVVPAQATRTVYPRERYRRSYELTQTFDVRLNEDNGGYSERGGLQWLCLDMVEAADIDWYLESRADRPSYMEHYHMLRMARRLLQAEGEALAPLFAKLEAAFVDNGVAAPEGSDARTVARHAIRLWRTSNRGAMPPAADEAGHAAAYKTMLGSMWVLAGNDHPIAAAEELAAAEGRTPLRLVLTGKERFALYATSAGDEVESRLFEHPWVTRIACQRKAGKLVPTSRAVMAMPDAVADEEVLREWDAIADWRGRAVPKRLDTPRYSDEERRKYDHAGIRKAFAMVETGTLSHFERNGDLAMRLAELRRHRTTKTGKSGRVADLAHVQPFAVIRTTAFTRKLVSGFTSRYEEGTEDADFLVLSLQDEPYRMAHRLAADDEGRRRVVEAFIESYAQKATNRSEFVTNAGRPPTIGWHRLLDWTTMGIEPDLRERSYRSVPLNANWAESVREFDVQRRAHDHDGDKLWAPSLTDMLVWIDPAAPAILNDLCRRFGWDAIPFTPKAR